MKPFTILLPAFVLLGIILLASCSPHLYYIGDQFNPTDSVQVYYNLQDIQKPYKVIGRLTNEPGTTNDPNVVKEAMIKKAKQIGANGIVFDELRSTKTSLPELHSQLIRFTNP